MINFSAIKTIAGYEAKLLWRSWAFRIFSIIGLLIIIGTTIGIGARFSQSPYFLSALSSSLPLATVKMLNMYQGIIAAFLATEFFKRDRKHDTNQVFLTRSYSNADYILGKVSGILFVFFVLNVLALISTLIMHFTITDSSFLIIHYLLYPVIISLPTLVFMIGASVFLITLIRNQAVVFVLMIVYSLLVMIYIGKFGFAVFDSYALYSPVLYSDFFGFANLRDIILLRGAYLLIGIGLLFVTVLFSKRLVQSRSSVTGMAIFGGLCLFLAASMITIYLQTNYQARAERNQWREISLQVVDYPGVSIINNNISVSWRENTLSAESNITAVNDTKSSLDSLLFSLNPGLEVKTVTSTDNQPTFRRDNHLLWVFPEEPLKADEKIEIAVSYSGALQDSYCYLDIDNTRYEDILSAWLYRMPKRYSMVSSKYVHLTPEVGWYPISSLSPGTAFPGQGQIDFTNYTLSVSAPTDMKAFSQGRHSVSEIDPGEHLFQPESPLTGMSLTVGNYVEKSIEVDSVEYTIAYFPGHDFFNPYLDQIEDTLPDLILNFKNDFEIQLGLEYPFKRFSLIETPAEIYAYKRFWTTALEMVQPEIMFIPELGIGGMTDFPRLKRTGTRMQERMNQAKSDIENQTMYLTNYVRMDILGTVQNRRDPRRNDNIETRTSVLPLFISYAGRVQSPSWPMMNYALETYYAEKVEPEVRKSWWDVGGMTNAERANLALQDKPLEFILADTTLNIQIRQSAIKNKGSHFYRMLKSKTKGKLFEENLNEFMSSHRFSNIDEKTFANFFNTQGEIKFSELANVWSDGTEMPGYVVENVDSYKVIDGNRTKTQIKFSLSNPTEIEGLVNVNFRAQQQRQGSRGPRWMREQVEYDYSELVYMPANSTRNMGIILDKPPAQMIIETFISLNIPGNIVYAFTDLELDKKARPYSGDSLMPYIEDVSVDSNVILVDNEDKGFSIISSMQESLLRKKFVEWFDLNEMEDPYVRLRWWSPPGIWMPTTDKMFYGQFIRSAMHKESANGESSVAWEVDLDESGSYDVYFHYEGDKLIPQHRWRHDSSSDDPGSLNFTVYGEDGQEDIRISLAMAIAGWNYIGTFQFGEGENRVELSDKKNDGIIIADAVKFVRR
ncbi:MAG: hypothetical protein KAR42_07855 [candidate division Zixibacteria bacterium]|nr:hypothetical protein [candidate division Zixibacteria bacterium]